MAVGAPSIRSMRRRYVRIKRRRPFSRTTAAAAADEIDPGGRRRRADRGDARAAVSGGRDKLYGCPASQVSSDIRPGPVRPRGGWCGRCAVRRLDLLLVLLMLMLLLELLPGLLLAAP